MATDPVVSPADTIRRVLGELGVLRYGSYERPQVHDGFAAVDEWEAVGERDRQQIARLTEALTHVGDGTLDNLCWCGEEWIGDDDPLDEEREHSEWCLRARAVLAGEEDAANG